MFGDLEALRDSPCVRACALQAAAPLRVCGSPRRENSLPARAPSGLPQTRARPGTLRSPPNPSLTLLQQINFHHFVQTLSRADYQRKAGTAFNHANAWVPLKSPCVCAWFTSSRWLPQVLGEGDSTLVNDTFEYSISFAITWTSTEPIINASLWKIGVH